MSIYDQMRTTPPPTSPYKFTPPPGTDPNRFRITPPGSAPVPPPALVQQPGQPPVQQPVQLRMGTQQPAYQPLSAGAPAGQPRGIMPNNRNADGDRPYPYAPQRQNGAVEHWRPPTWREILKELGWRMLESGIQAVAYEIAYYFGNRRFGIPTYVQT